MANIPNPPQENRFINQVCSNTKTDFIEITEDKLENILIKFIRNLKKASGWLTPLSVFTTLLITNLSADFKLFAGIQKETWSAIFIIAMIVSFVWLLIKLFMAVMIRKEVKVEYLI